MQERRDSGKGRFREEGCRKRRMQERRDTGIEGFRKGEMQGRRDSGYFWLWIP